MKTEYKRIREMRKTLFKLVMTTLATWSLSAFADVAKGVFAASSGKETVVVQKVTAASTGNRQSDEDTLVFKYTFPDPTFEGHGDGTATVRMNGVENLGEVGNPSLPTLPVRLAIPKGRELLSVECDGELVQAASEVVLRHVYRPIPTNATITEETPRNEAVYGSDEPFPERCFSEYNIASKRGVQFVDFCLTPVMYKGLSGEVWYYPHISVVLSLKPLSLKPQGTGTPRLMSTSGVDTNGVRSKDDTDAVIPLLDNPEEVESYVPSKSSGGVRLIRASTLASSANYSSIPYVHPTLPCETDGDFPAGYKHVVITSQALLSAFEQLVMYRREQGVSSTAVTVEQIKNHYSGIDTQEKIRNFIKDAYQTWNTEFVVLGGDTGHVPARGLYCSANGEMDYLPSDLYYQCLDGDFNADGDSTWGETNDGVDWYAEIAIGRVSAENATEVNNWLMKLQQYNADVQNGKSYTKAMLSVGEDMGADWGSSRYASVFQEQTRKGGSYNGYTTKGFDSSSNYTTYDTLYDSANYTWQASDLISKINANKYAVLNHLGHGNYNWNMKLSPSDVDSRINNTSPIFVYSWACISGAFDKDCMAEHFTTSSQYGCFGGVWNSRYGWGSINGTDGMSHRVARHFWNAVFTATDSNNGMSGLANQLSHERNASAASSGNATLRWVIYESNLFGDPIQQIDGVTLSGGGNQLSISKPSVTFSAAGGTGSADVTASSSWTVTASDSWITLNTTSGSGNGTISYSVLANTGTSERSGTITVRSGNETATQRITQSAEAARLSVNPTVKDFGCAAGNGSFDVQANYSWTVEKSASWITLVTSSGIGNGSVLYSVIENTGARRTGTITVRIGSVTATHTVTQAARPTLNISPSEASVSASAANGSFAVTSDSMWTVTKSSAATWITLRTTNGSGNGTVSYSIEQNNGERRTGYIYVKSGTVQRTYALTQRCANTVVFSESTVSVPVDGGNGTVTASVLSDGSSTHQASSSYSGDWISWTRSETTIEDGVRYTYSWSAQKNDTGSAREATLGITLNGTVYRCTFVQDPAAGSYRITYKPGAYGTGSEISLTKKAGELFVLKGAIYTRSGYTQKGWATTDGGGRAYGLMSAYTEDKSIVLYPYWEPSSSGGTTYTITFAPGRYGTGSFQTATKTQGVALTLPGALFTRDGYAQAGWATDWAGSTKVYDLGGSYTTDAEAKLYPYWVECADEEEYDIGFYTPSGWKQPMCLSSTNLSYWAYAPQYVFGQGDGLVLNYCVWNYSATEATLEDRHMSLWNSDLAMVEAEIESNPDTIQTGMLFPNRNLSGWLSSLAPGNYALQVYLDPYDKLKDTDESDNGWVEWFAVRADGISLNEALDCGSLYFTDNDSTAFVQTSESIVGGSCVQFGPQPTNSFDSAELWVYVTEPGTLTFKWKATSQDGYKAYLGCYVNGELAKYKWATEQTEWEEAFVTIDTAPLWVCWRLGTFEPDAGYLTAGWLDNLTWNPSGRKPTFTVDGSGTLTGVVLNGVTDLEIPSMVDMTAVRAIGAYVLTNTPITSVSIPSTVVSIERYAFSNNQNLSGVTIPGSVKYIYSSAFAGCGALKSVVLNEGVEAIGNYAFYNCGNLATIHIPASVNLIDQSPFGNCPSLRTITVAPGNRHYEVQGNALVDKTYNTLIQYPSGRTESTYDVPDGIARIGYDAFDRVTSLTEVTLPRSVTTLGSYAFYGCANLGTLTFHGDAPTVGDYAFYGVASSCKALVSPQSSGWGVSIPGTWQGLSIAYSQNLARYEVTYSPGAFGSGASHTESKYHGITLPLKGSLFTRTGYEQTGWSLVDGGALAYDLGAPYMANAPVTLYPFWTAVDYSVSYELAGGLAGEFHPSSATFGTAFRVSAPTRVGYAFMGWMVTSGLDTSTARYGASAEILPYTVDSDSQQCYNGSDADVWFANLTSVPGGGVTLTATWEEADDGSRDIGFYAPGSKGWEFPVCLSSTNIDYLAYAPETEFEQFSNVYLSFCAVNWSRAGTAILQSTRLTITDESGNVHDEGEPIQRYPLGAYGYAEFRNLALRRYLGGITPGRYKLTLELDPNRLVDDPDRSNNTTSIWFTITAPADPIPALPGDAYRADIAAALAGSADPALAENITDIATYSAYREWAQSVKGPDGNTAVGKQAVKDASRAWLSFALGAGSLITRPIVSEDISIESFEATSSPGEFALTASISGVGIGAGVTITNGNRNVFFENLAKVICCKGSETLNANSFTSDNVNISFDDPLNGKVRFTVQRSAPRTTSQQSEESFFLKVAVKTE